MDLVCLSCAGITTLDQKTNMVHCSAQEYFSNNYQTHSSSGYRYVAAAHLELH